MTIEWLRQPVQHPRFAAALFDFDGTLSLIRSGWQPIMTEFMFEVLADASPNVDPQELTEEITAYIARSTGQQTIYQMIHLAEQVQTRGKQPLEPLAYKQEYNRRLLQHIEHRRESLSLGKRQPDEFLVPGSAELVATLRQSGLNLVLASGTDAAYVKHEAKLLGLAASFAPHIYGAVDDYKQFSKANVIRHMLKEQSIAGTELIGFGDGYVEIECVKRVGGLAIGVAADESCPHQLDHSKRQRLIQAGADAIIAHYEPVEQLLAAIGIPK